MYLNILIGVDGRGGGRDAIALARRLAAPDAELTLVNVYEEEWTPGRREAVTRRRRGRAAHELLGNELRSVKIDAAVTAVPASSVAKGLTDLAAARQTDLIVVGVSRRGAVGRLLLSDDASATVDRAPCAVAIAPNGYRGPDKLRAIGVGHGGGPEIAQLLAAARRLVPATGSRIVTLPAPLTDDRVAALDLLILGARDLRATELGCPLLVLPQAQAVEDAVRVVGAR